MDVRCGTWNGRSPYRADSPKRVAVELAEHNLDLVSVQEVIWVEGDSQQADDYTFFHGNGMLIVSLGQDSLYFLPPIAVSLP